jgi:uncharacterized membrane protein
MPLWLIPIVYAVASTSCALALPRLEYAYFPATMGISVTSAQAFLSAVASGTMALTGIVFAVAFVMVQFSAIAYSPRLVLWFARDRTLFHSLGVFVAAFIYSLATIVWVDRNGSGIVPLVSMLLVGVFLIFSVLLFAVLVQRLANLQITNVLRLVGNKGREVIRNMFDELEERPAAEWKQAATETLALGALVSTVKYFGEPRVVARFDINSLARQAQLADGTIVMDYGVGDTLVHDSVLLRVYATAEARISEKELLRAVVAGDERTFEQDPKYPLRLLVDIAIKALSPAVNDPTTAVQAIDQIEDLLRRLGARDLDAGYAKDREGKVRVVFPMPTWEDYLTLAFDEIRQFGTTSVQVIRRLRSALVGIAESVTLPARAEAVQRYLDHLDLLIEHSPFDTEDRSVARQEDRQGLGLSRRHPERTAAQRIA